MSFVQLRALKAKRTLHSGCTEKCLQIAVVLRWPKTFAKVVIEGFLPHGRKRDGVARALQIRSPGGSASKRHGDGNTAPHHRFRWRIRRIESLPLHSTKAA